METRSANGGSSSERRCPKTHRPPGTFSRTNHSKGNGAIPATKLVTGEGSAQQVFGGALCAHFSLRLPPPVSLLQTPLPRHPRPRRQSRYRRPLQNRAIRRLKARTETRLQRQSPALIALLKERLNLGLKSRGFANVTQLRKDEQGIWRGRAQRNGTMVDVALDFQGNVFPAQP